MSKMTRAWIEAQIEHEMERGNHPDAVRDLAALIEVRKYMMEQDEDDAHREPAPIAHMKEHPRQIGFQSNDHEAVLNKETVMEWVEEMEDSEGVKGGKYTWHQAQQYAMNKGITGHQRQLEFYWAMNAMYADYHEAGKKFGVDKPDFYACLAKLFIEDPDAVDNKVEEYHRHIAKHHHQ